MIYKSKNYNYIILLIAILNFAACALGPDFEAPEVYLNKTYRESELSNESIVNLKWWEFFKDPVLHELIKEAVENNKDLNVAIARIERARASLGITRSDQFPGLNISGNAQRTDPSDEIFTFVTSPINNFSLLGNLAFELDIWGKLRRATESARASLLSTEYAKRALTISLVADVAANYFQILGAENRLQISRDTFKNRKGATRLIGERFEKGIIPEIDLNQAQIEEASARVAVTVTERNLRLAENSLSILLGKVPSEIKKGSPFYSQELSANLPTGFPAELLERRPDIKSAEENAHAKVANIGVAKAQQLPGLNLTGFIGYQSIDSDNLLKSSANTWNIAGGLLGPLIDFGRSDSVIEFAEADAKEALLQYEQAVIQAVREVEDSLISIKTSDEGYLARKDQVKAAANAAKLSRARYDAGETTYLEVLDIERSLFEAELGASIDREFYLTSIILLYKALGGGWEQETEPKI